MTVSSADVEYGLFLLAARQDRDRKFRNYYDGLFNLRFVSRSFRESFGAWLQNLGYNRCANVVDFLADRTTVDGWDSPGGNDEIVKRAEDIWRRNDMSNRQHEVVKDSYTTGDGYLHVWPDEVTGQARLYANPSHEIVVVPDREYPDRVLFAVKCWQEVWGPDKGRWRLTVYDAEQVVRLITRTKPDTIPVKFTRFELYEGDGQPEAENPFGVVPVIHFGNDARTGRDGKSELADIVPLQDGVNKTIADSVVAEEYGAYPQRIIIGLDEPEKDPITGQAVSPFDPGMNRLWFVPGAAQDEQPVTATQFQPVDLTQFIAVQDAWDLKIARVSRTPVHWLLQSGGFPSGESLKTAEAPFVSKVKDRQGSFTAPWAAVMRLALKAEGASDEDIASIEPVWMPAESRSERERHEIAQFKKNLGIPDEMIWAELGYSTGEIAEMTRLKAEAQARQTEQFASSFGRGDQDETEGGE